MNLAELFKSIKNDNLSKVKEILNDRPSFINEYLYGVTPLHYSIECQNEKIALELCQYPKIQLNLKDNLNENCIQKAIENKMYSLVQKLCKLDKSISLNETLANQETLLTNCIKLGDNEAVVALINAGADINLPNKLGQLPIELAIKFNKLQVVQEILKRNNITLVLSKNGYNTLLDACEKDLTEICLLLIENGADLNAQDDCSITPLMHAVNNGNEILVKKLIESKADLNVQDVDGNTALHYAVLSENEYILRILLNANAQRDMRNAENQTALDIAKLNEDDIILQLLTK